MADRSSSDGILRVQRILLVLLVSALVAVSGSVASAATIRPTVRVSYATPKVSPRGVLTVRASVLPKTTSCKLTLRGPSAHVVKLPAKRGRSGKLDWTYRVPNGAVAGNWTTRATCGKTTSAARSFVVEAPVLKANVVATNSGFTQNTDSSTGALISYGVVLNNSASNVDALNVAVTVAFTDTNGDSVSTQTTTLTGIPAGGTFYLGGLTSSNVSLTVASMKVSVTVGSTQAHRLTLPPVSGLSLQTDEFDDGNVTGTFSNPYAKPIPSNGQIYVVYLNSQGAVIGGASESAGASVEPGGSVAFGLDGLSDIYSSFVPVGDVATIQGSIDPCGSFPGGPPLLDSSCPAQVPIPTS